MSACNSYEQSNKMCSDCIRNIGFTSDSHQLWSTFVKVYSYKSGVKEEFCNGYIPSK